MKLLLVITFSFVLSIAWGQKQKIIAEGDNAYVIHKVISKETYDAIAKKYNISPVAIADYNNLEYHKGKLLAKFLKVPLTSRNFIKSATAKEVDGLAAVYRKLRSGKLVAAGYFVIDNRKVTANKRSGIPAKVDVNNHTTSTAKDVGAVVAEQKATSDPLNNDSAKANGADQSSDTAVDVVVKKTTEVEKVKPVISKSWIKKSKVDYTKRNYGPGRFTREFFSSAIINSAITLFLILVIYFYLLRKKERFFTEEKLKNDIVKLISGAILNEDKEQAMVKLAFELPKILKNQFQRNEVRQLLMDEIITAKRSFRGRGASNLVLLYEELGLVQDSVAKLKSKRWYVKAKGIQELAVMDQSKFLFRIFRQTNSTNENVRMEAQSAIVHFAGFKGLRFLKVLTFPISDWQQIKLIEQLSFLPNQELPDAIKFLKSQNNSVVIFTLKIIGVFRYLSLHDSVAACLHYRNAAVRFQAIKTLTQINNSSTASTLQNVYAEDELKIKIAILEALKIVGSEEQTDFLYLQLFNENDDIKLAAAEALMECCPDALQLVNDVSLNKGYPYTSIFNHLKEGALV